MFADDCVMYQMENTKNSVLGKLHKDLSRIPSWTSINVLRLNVNTFQLIILWQGYKAQKLNIVLLL